MTHLDREGIFKARPTSWAVKTFPNSRAVAIAIEFVIVAQLDGQEWIDWSGCAPHTVRGDYFVVKKDGTVNAGTAKQLAESMGWEGSLNAVASRPMNPPEVVVQITVKAEEYNGKTYHKAGWMNPEHFVPGPSGASEQEVRGLDAQFGSLLKAATASAKAAKPAAPKTQGARTPPPPPAEPVAPVDPGEIPF